MKGDAIITRILCTRIIPNADAALLEKLGAPRGDRCLGIISTDSDDVSYIALDDATKRAEVRVLYAKSLYAGAKNASTRLAGEFIGVLSGPGPAEVRSGLEAAASCIRHDAHFLNADDAGSIYFLAHTVSQSGTYLSKIAAVDRGTPLAYLIAPPAEALPALDAALKAAKVSLKVFYGPPTETNFAGAILSGEQAACRAVCEAFAQSVYGTAARPLDIE
ncbi:MAG: ethanolamine utilization microcompartment protein EutL [Spirochaetaceae bacterium]|jgi:ethanolamine utilization protein EutL|nr:ethanolamine utilization microcompartment protein EutL [Spirochaetaceae bacterium]